MSKFFNDLLDNYHNIWIWSDTHFFHKNIIKYANRPFADVDEMNAFMKKVWQESVGPYDLIINCGDFTFGSTTSANEILAECPGYKVLIEGNHDYEKKNRLRNLNFDYIADKEEFEYQGHQFILTHVPMLVASLQDRLNIHGHIHQHNYVENFDTPDAFESPYHACVSVEHTLYRPKLLFDVCDELLTKSKSARDAKLIDTV